MASKNDEPLKKMKDLFDQQTSSFCMYFVNRPNATNLSPVYNEINAPITGEHFNSSV
jgi:hypothetical protein